MLLPRQVRCARPGLPPPPFPPPPIPGAGAEQEKLGTRKNKRCQDQVRRGHPPRHDLAKESPTGGRAASSEPGCSLKNVSEIDREPRPSDVPSKMGMVLAPSVSSTV